MCNSTSNTHHRAFQEEPAPPPRHASGSDGSVHWKGHTCAQGGSQSRNLDEFEAGMTKSMPQPPGDVKAAVFHFIRNDKGSVLTLSVDKVSVLTTCLQLKSCHAAYSWLTCDSGSRSACFSDFMSTPEPCHDHVLMSDRNRT